MTLHAFDRATNKSIRAVDVPLQFVDWMAEHFDGKFIKHLREINPYGDILIPEYVLESASDELIYVQNQLRSRRATDVPNTVELYGAYGVMGALKTIQRLLEFLERTEHATCKVVSIGD